MLVRLQRGVTIELSPSPVLASTVTGALYVGPLPAAAAKAMR